jgi:hypothetical protein
VTEADGAAAAAPAEERATAQDATAEEEAEQRAGEVERLASAIYGTVVTASVLVATGGRLSVAVTCTTVLATVLVYWLAETYARALAHQIHTPAGQRPPVFAKHTWRLVSASYAPLAVLLIVSALGVGVWGAILAALIFSTILLGIVGWIAADKAGLHGVQRLVAVSLSLSFGLVMIALKLAIAH